MSGFQMKGIPLIAVGAIVLNGCSALFNPSITLHAKLVDQHGVPAPDVKVYYHATIAPLIQAPMVGPGTEDYQTVTGHDGLLSVKHSGISIWLDQMEHPNYVFIPRGYKMFRGEQYHLPANAIWPTGELSTSNPVIIPVWKREGAVTLLEDGKAIYSPQGTNIIREPITGTPMVLEIEWNATGSDRSPGLWSVKLKVLNGAIQETDSAFPFEAPVSGYQAEWIGGAFSQPSVDSLSKNFYIVDADKKYFGRLHATIKPYFGTKKHIGLRWWINPNGERGLLNNTASGD